MNEFEACLSLAGDKLVMVAVESEEECVMSDDMWSKEAKGGTDAGPEACRTLSASLAHRARGRERRLRQRPGARVRRRRSRRRAAARRHQVPHVPVLQGTRALRAPRTNARSLVFFPGSRTFARKISATRVPDPPGPHLRPHSQDGKLLWQHVGAGAGANQALAEGVLYYGGAGAQGLNVADYISEITTRADLGFIQSCAMAQPPRGFLHRHRRSL